MGLDFALLSGLYGDVTAFTAKAEVRVYGKDKKEKSVTPFDFAQLDNKVRAEVEMSKMVNKDVPEAAAGALKQMDRRVISIKPPGQEGHYVIVQHPVVREHADVQGGTLSPPKRSRRWKKPNWQGELDGHACVKNKSHASLKQRGEKHESTVWFPLT